MTRQYSRLKMFLEYNEFETELIYDCVSVKLFDKLGHENFPQVLWTNLVVDNIVLHREDTTPFPFNFVF